MSKMTWLDEVKPKRPALRYFGGKWRIAEWIISYLPEHKVYVEPFGGAASVLIKKPRSYAEVYNDIDDSVYSFFRVLADEMQSKELKRVVEATPFSRREFELAHTYHPEPVEKARRLIVRSFMGFGADSATNLESKTGFRSNSNRSGTTPAHDWVNYPSQIPLLYERLKGVVIENQDAFKIIKTHDSPQTLFYVDPPYSHDTRRGGRYKHEMDNFSHAELIKELKLAQGSVVLSGYHSDFYAEHLSGWRVVEREARADKAGLPYLTTFLAQILTLHLDQFKPATSLHPPRRELNLKYSLKYEVAGLAEARRVSAVSKDWRPLIDEFRTACLSMAA